MDNGKIRIEIRDGLPIIEVYHHGEIGLSDLIWVRHALLNNVEPPLELPTDIVVDRSGSYSLSEDAYVNMRLLMQESNRIAYVIHTPAQEVIVNLAINSYLADKVVSKFSTVEAALKWLRNPAADMTS
jgi:hypothetical protein